MSRRLGSVEQNEGGGWAAQGEPMQGSAMQGRAGQRKRRQGGATGERKATQGSLRECW